jgi:tripartite-type tricarboxylate transporter receptor subunit TctC
MNRRRLVAAAAGGVGALAAPAVLRAQGAAAWPERPVRIVVPYPPGGSNDTVARLLQPRVQEILGRSIVVENRGGASGAVGAGETVRSAPDGYTWLLANDTVATNDTLMQLPYRAADGFTFCTLVGTCPYALVTHKDQPYRTLADVIAAAKARPETLNYATTGVGSLAHISTVLLEQQGGFKLVHVPYRGGGPALQDAVAGHVPLFMSNIVIILPHIRQGTLRPLGVSSPQPSRFLPGVPTFASQGFPGFESLTYWVLLGPAGIPEPITRRMQAAVAQALAEPAVRARMDEQGADVVASSPEECAAFVRREIEKWREVIRVNGIRLEG